MPFRGWTSFERLVQDLRFGLRVFRKNPAFTIVAVLTLALGIGANTAIFSVVNGLIIRSLPFRDVRELVWITNSDGSGGPSSVTSRTFNFRDFRKLNRSFSGIAAYNAFFGYGSYNLTGNGEPERLVAVNVSQGLFQLLGVVPALGRSFTSEECVRTGRAAAMLSYAFWNSKFGADPAIVGKTILINARPTVVVGVTPEEFQFASVFAPGVRVDMFVPMFVDAEQDADGNEVAMIGRLKPGVSINRARADIAAIVAQLRRQDPNRWGLAAHMMLLEDYVTKRLRPALLVLMCAVSFVLLIACANLSNLLLARATARRKEIALRIAVGAGRFRLIRQMLTESITLSVIGGVLGLPLAWWGTHYMAHLRGSAVPLLNQVSIDRRAFLFTLLLSMAAGVFFGMIPAFQSSRTDVNHALKENTAGAGGGRNRDWTRNVLVVSEVSLALILLGGAGLMMRSFLKLLDTELGFRPEHIAVVRIDPGAGFDELAKLIAYQRKIVNTVRQIPGVEAASLTDAVPLDRDRSWTSGIVGVDYGNNGPPDSFVRVIAPGYFETMKIRLLQGRTFTELDGAASPRVVVINQTLARTLFHGQNPLGRQIFAGAPAQVIGVVDDVKHSALDEEAGSEFYLSYQQSRTESADLVVRTTLQPDAFLPTLRRSIWSFAPNQPLAEARTLDQLVDTAVSSRKFTILLLAIFAGLALLLASIGIYGVISYSAVQRTREMGIRIALGANGGSLQWQIVREAVSLTLAGTLLGAAGMIVLSRYLRSLLFETTPNDPITMAAVTFILITVAAIASYFPARRASRIDPIAALRFE